MSYVPPALRRKQEAVARGEKLSDEATGSEVSLVDSANQLPTVTDVQNHFWPPQKADSSTSRPSGAAGIPDSPAIARRESNQAFDGTANTVDDGKTEPDGSTSVVSKSNLPHLHSTLNGTRAEPDRLKYVLLFHQAVSLAILLQSSTTYVLILVSDAETAPSVAHGTNHLCQVRAATPTTASISRPVTTVFHFARKSIFSL